MFLKRLESVGFKSFAERIHVDFVPGVTAVVGPNGSGKSNITDAVRWVLGEQSAKSLRGSKMEDIIFQGSDTRRALNVAEVTLVLDNNDHALPLDYEEVSVTRRVYRSGESEYYINKQACRLKDIVDLFMDSGLGREAFSIISQGKVEEILSSKAVERRTIFEEAAGVLKYKQRKKKAEYKLAETQENLNRVEDIVNEVEQQMSSLENQAKTAEKYLQFKDELTQSEVSLLITVIDTLHTQWRNLLKDIEVEKEKEISLKTAIQGKEATVERERNALQLLDQEIEKFQEDLLKTTQELEKYEGRKKLLHERTKHATENREKLEKQIDQTSVKIGKLHEEFIKEKKKLSALNDRKKSTQQSIKELKGYLELDQEALAEQIEDLKSDYIELLNQQAAKRNELQSIAKQLQQINGKKDQQDVKFKELLKNREDTQLSVKKLSSSLSISKAEVEDKEKLIQHIKDSISAERTVFEQAQSKLYQGYQYIEKLKSKQEMLQEMKQDFQGFFQGVKAILKARENEKLHDIYGAVIELIDVPNRYITAIETVLGGQSQHVVVKNEKAARDAIYWLKKTNNGRATFLPLDSIQERYISPDLLYKVKEHPGFVGIAADLIKIDASFSRAVKHLMGHVVIAQSLKDANEIAGIVKRKFRIVTVEGDVVNPGGAMSGGANKKTNQSLFTREKELQELTDKLKDFQEKTLSFEQQVKDKRQRIKELEQQLSDEESILIESKEKLQQHYSNSKEQEMKLDALNSQLEMYDYDRNQYKNDHNSLIQREKQLTIELTKIKEELNSLQNKMDDLTKQEKMYNEQQDANKSKLHQKQVLLAEQEERMKSQKEKTNGVQNQLEELQQQYDLFQKELVEIKYVDNSTHTEEELDNIIISNKESKTSLTDSIQRKRLERTNRSQLLEDNEREIKEENKKHQTQLQLIQQKEVKANRLDVELENHLSQLQSDYMITYEKAQQAYEKTKDIEKSKAVVNQLKQQIENLGTVNIGAIDEFKRINERYSFLTEQRADLIEAKQTLYAIIKEMDEEMIKRFDETFSQIKEEFAVVFHQLFGGGRAELKLTDPKKLLETGVEIVAQPPGKKLQNLGLLSGGERALTAIALLFAILRVRPVPFCILDEVEAALDEANVVRFAKYVKLYSENTQFIVITHRKGTMEEADVLYGVTMQESGVSRLVSVRLEDTKELVNS
ncbi:chromosome segregation protein SMC [Virgibacillus halodenitrificans]|uniref:chromosome segregation protein SMC n=1 Tax=Virgibacillus halodenitrificans TaxID=1482 RepID=UPI001F435653|nr:chromosome segregation protein SMC [Virgibacillus halodenitrificans]WHX27134.1 chromosome segregation protein SMC [Virgibacillus halodenitrificans]